MANSAQNTHLLKDDYYRDLELDSPTPSTSAFHTAEDFNRAYLKETGHSRGSSDDSSSAQTLVGPFTIPRRFGLGQVVLAAIVGAFIGTLCLLAALRSRLVAGPSHDIGSPSMPAKSIKAADLVKPPGVPIVGVVFCESSLENWSGF